MEKFEPDTEVFDLSKNPARKLTIRYYCCDYCECYCCVTDVKSTKVEHLQSKILSKNNIGSIDSFVIFDNRIFKILDINIDNDEFIIENPFTKGKIEVKEADLTPYTNEFIKAGYSLGGSLNFYGENHTIIGWTKNGEAILNNAQGTVSPIYKNDCLLSYSLFNSSSINTIVKPSQISLLKNYDNETKSEKHVPVVGDYICAAGHYGKIIKKNDDSSFKIRCLYDKSVREVTSNKFRIIKNPLEGTGFILGDWFTKDNKKFQILGISEFNIICSSSGSIYNYSDCLDVFDENKVDTFSYSSAIFPINELQGKTPIKQPSFNEGDYVHFAGCYGVITKVLSDDKFEIFSPYNERCRANGIVTKNKDDLTLATLNTKKQLYGFKLGDWVEKNGKIVGRILGFTTESMVLGIDKLFVFSNMYDCLKEIEGVTYTMNMSNADCIHNSRFGEYKKCNPPPPCPFKVGEWVSNSFGAQKITKINLDGTCDLVFFDNTIRISVKFDTLTSLDSSPCIKNSQNLKIGDWVKTGEKIAQVEGFTSDYVLVKDSDPKTLKLDKSQIITANPDLDWSKTSSYSYTTVLKYEFPKVGEYVNYGKDYKYYKIIESINEPFSVTISRFNEIKTITDPNELRSIAPAPDLQNFKLGDYLERDGKIIGRILGFTPEFLTIGEDELYTYADLLESLPESSSLCYQRHTYSMIINTKKLNEYKKVPTPVLNTFKVGDYASFENKVFKVVGVDKYNCKLKAINGTKLEIKCDNLRHIKSSPQESKIQLNDYILYNNIKCRVIGKSENYFVVDRKDITSDMRSDIGDRLFEAVDGFDFNNTYKGVYVTDAVKCDPPDKLKIGDWVKITDANLTAEEQFVNSVVKIVIETNDCFYVEVPSTFYGGYFLNTIKGTILNSDLTEELNSKKFYCLFKNYQNKSFIKVVPKKIHPENQSIVAKIAEESKQAGIRIGVRKLSKSCHDTLISLLRSNQLSERSISVIANMLDSEFGRAILTGLLALSLHKIEDEKVQILSDELRIEGMTCTMEALLNKLTYAPKSNIRVQTTSNQSTNTNQDEEDEECYSEPKYLTN